MKKVKVIQNPEKEVPIGILAEAIVSMAQGIRKLRPGPMNDRALFLLIQHAAPNVGRRRSPSPLSVKQIKAVFERIDRLESEYLKKKA